jgi:hypothetical protein
VHLFRLEFGKIVYPLKLLLFISHCVFVQRSVINIGVYFNCRMRGAQTVSVSSFEVVCDFNCYFISDFMGLWKVENCNLIRSCLGLFWRTLVMGCNILENLGMLR